MSHEIEGTKLHNITRAAYRNMIQRLANQLIVSTDPTKPAGQAKVSVRSYDDMHAVGNKVATFTYKKRTFTLCVDIDGYFCDGPTSQVIDNYQEHPTFLKIVKLAVKHELLGMRRPGTEKESTPFKRLIGHKLGVTDTYLKQVKAQGGQLANKSSIVLLLPYGQKPSPGFVEIARSDRSRVVLWGHPAVAPDVLKDPELMGTIAKKLKGI